MVEKPSAKRAEEAIRTAIEYSSVAVEDLVCIRNPKVFDKPFSVTGHPRKLHEGWHASPDKIDEAKKNGIDLLPGYTWVTTYLKGKTAA